MWLFILEFVIWRWYALVNSSLLPSQQTFWDSHWGRCGGDASSPKLKNNVNIWKQYFFIFSFYFHRLICFASSYYSQDMFTGSLNMWLLQLISTKSILGEGYVKSLKEDMKNLWCWFLFGLLGTILVCLVWGFWGFLQREVWKCRFKKYFKKKN